MKTESAIGRRWQTRTLTVAGLLGAVSVVLGMTPLGFIPVPTAAGHATIMHVPAILGGVLEGPVVGALTGLIFGLYSFMQAGSALFADPLIAVLPRIFIGVVAYGVYRLTKSDALAAAFGTITNTAGVLGLAVLRGYLTGPVAWGVALTHGIPEIAVAVAITVIVSKSCRKFRR
ncbi:MAG TPA: ECF transporter S component [Thermoanaerobacterales bacterium]|nr:ECF transporter S component [Thermoanaerobacterales bacterium]